MRAARQWFRVYRLGRPYDIEIVHAHYVEHRFARHAHEHFVIGLIETGVQRYTYGGTRHTTPAGNVFFVNGDEPHTGEPATAEGYVYRTLCLGSQTFRRLVSKSRTETIIRPSSALLSLTAGSSLDSDGSIRL